MAPSTRVLVDSVVEVSGGGFNMALEGPRLVYVRKEDGSEDVLTRALDLARQVEELLEETSSVPSATNWKSGAHSTRIVRAMAASLVDELEAIVRGTRKSSGLS